MSVIFIGGWLPIWAGDWKGAAAAAAARPLRLRKDRRFTGSSLSDARRGVNFSGLAEPGSLLGASSRTLQVPDPREPCLQACSPQ